MQKTTLLLRNLNELSENVSFNSEIQSFKVACFFLNANFSKYSRAEWVNTNILYSINFHLFLKSGTANII